MNRHHRSPFALSSLRLLPSARCLLPTVLLLLTAHCSLLTIAAQSTSATLGGTVADQNGAVVPGATITAENKATGLKRQATTNDQGSFTIPLLPPSTYTVTAQAQGFSPVQISNVVLNVGDLKSLTIPLKAGNISEMVQIEGGAALTNESAAVGTVVDRQFVGNLPLNGRSFQSLITLAPGVVLTKANVDAPGQFSVNGQRANANYFMIDGVGANIGVSPGTNVGVQTAGTTPGLAATGGTNNLVSVDALQEFKILTSSFSPEFGRTPGAQVQILTRSGTNDFHGTVFEYFRNDKLDATDWFTNANPLLKKAALRQNDFGGVIGGPLSLPRFGEGGPSLYSGKNRTFFFFSYEGLRLRLPNTGITTVPSLNARASAPAGIQPLLNAFPLPNGNDVGNNLAGFNATYSDPSSLDAASIRIDHAVNQKLTLFARYNYSPSEASVRGGGFSLSTVNQSTYKTQTLTGGATLLISSAISNDFRANYSKNRGKVFFALDSFGGATPLADEQIVSSFGSSETGNYFIGLGSIFLQKGTFGVDIQRQINLVDTLSVTKKNHQLKFGVDYRRLNPILDRARYSPSISFTSVTSAITTSRASSLSIASFYGPVFPVFTNLSLFGQDTWKVTNRLTLTYGSRWEYNPPPSEATGNDPLTVTGLNVPSTIALAPAGTPLYKSRYNNFAPRVGLAYQLSQVHGRETILRGGFGTFYDMGTASVASAFSVAFPYFRRKPTLTNVLYPFDSASAAPLSQSLSCPCGNINGILDPEFKLPYTYQWNVSVEQSIGANQTISASYVAALGRRLTRLETIANPNANFTAVRVTRNAASSDYHALQVQFQRRLSRGLQALGSYTWSHSIDNVSSDTSFEAPTFVIDPRQERGSSDFDVRHAFNAALTYDIPAPNENKYVNALLRNFSLDTTFTARTATPVNVITGTNTIGGASVTRPNLIPGIPLYSYDPTFAGGWRINNTVPTAAQVAAAGCAPITSTNAKGPFCTPSTSQQGTLGRNALRGFPLWQLDLAAHRKFNFTERVNLQLRVEFFNIFNHPNFADPIRQLNNALFGQSTTMLGRSLGTGGSSGGVNPLYQVGGPRSVQLALRLGF